MRKIRLIVGGVRSGKSNYAVELAKESNKKVYFLATCSPLDIEMEKRIENHKKNRPHNWVTIEENINIIDRLKSIQEDNLIIVDCLGLWISNMLMKEFSEDRIKEEIDNLIVTLNNVNFEIIFVSNEVGMGVVPESYLGRVFRDLLGLLNQKIAKIADEVIFMHVGIPVKIK